MFLLKSLRASVLCAFFGFSSMALSYEVSMVSGLFKSEKNKTGGQDAGGKTELSLGARYGDKMMENIDFYGEAGLVLRNYDAPDGSEAPSDSTSLTLKGGVRNYFTSFSTAVWPYVGAAAGYVNDKDANISANTQSETSGLFYWGLLGFRFNVAQYAFFDAEVELFESALFANTETTAINEEEGENSKTEKSRTEIYVKSNAGISTLTVGIGVKL